MHRPRWFELEDRSGNYESLPSLHILGLLVFLCVCEVVKSWDGEVAVLSYLLPIFRTLGSLVQEKNSSRNLSAQPTRGRWLVCFSASPFLSPSSAGCPGFYSWVPTCPYPAVPGFLENPQKEKRILLLFSPSTTTHTKTSLDLTLLSFPSSTQQPTPTHPPTTP